MTTYKQKNFKRNYDSTSVKFIQVLNNEVLNPEFWQVCEDSEIDCNQLWKEGDKIMFGYL
jgi:hypothetical protein